jgi:hypothetical protein
MTLEFEAEEPPCRESEVLFMSSHSKSPRWRACMLIYLAWNEPRRRGWSTRQVVAPAPQLFLTVLQERLGSTLISCK